MVEERKESVFVCDICLKPMGFWEIDKHKRDAHPEELKALIKAGKIEYRRYVKFVVPALGVGAAFVFYAVFMDITLIKIALLTFADATIGALVAFFLYSMKVGSPSDPVEDDFIAKCWICGVPHSKKDMKEHFAIYHPQELRYMMRSITAFFAPLIVMSIIMIGAINLVMLDVMSWDTFGVLTLTFGFGTLALMAGVIVFAGLVYPRHEKQSRDKWTGRV